MQNAKKKKKKSKFSCCRQLGHSQTPGARLGTRRSLTMPLSCWVWAPKVPPGPLAGFSETWPGNLHPGKFQVQLGGLVCKVLGGQPYHFHEWKEWQTPEAWTHNPRVMSQWSHPTHIYIYIHTYINYLPWRVFPQGNETVAQWGRSHQEDPEHKTKRETDWRWGGVIWY